MPRMTLAAYKQPHYDIRRNSYARAVQKLGGEKNMVVPLYCNKKGMNNED